MSEREVKPLYDQTYLKFVNCYVGFSRGSSQIGSCYCLGESKGMENFLA